MNPYIEEKSKEAVDFGDLVEITLHIASYYGGMKAGELKWQIK